MAVRIQVRNGQSDEWTQHNPLLMQGEIGLELDTSKWKIGNGIDNWLDLPYVTQGETGKSIEFNWNGTKLGLRTEGASSYEYVDLKGPKGDIGRAFTYDDFTPEQLALLKGPKGDPGEPFRFGDFTPEQLEQIKGEQGVPGSVENATAIVIGGFRLVYNAELESLDFEVIE